MIAHSFPLTKIVATIGPVSSGQKNIRQLVEAGVRVFRINFSHGTFEEYDKMVEDIRKEEERTGSFTAILGDLSGPKIRVGKVIEKGVFLQSGEVIRFVKKEVTGGSKGYEKVFSTTFPDFFKEVREGERLLLDDGNIELEFISRIIADHDEALECRVVSGNLLTSSKGINLPDTQLKLPALTEKDKECVAYAVKRGFDYLALSFVRSAHDIAELKQLLTGLHARPEGLNITGGDLGFSTLYDDPFIPVITKIEKPQAVDNLEEVIHETDGIMVARGDLGVEMDLAKLAILQKRIVKMCGEYGKPSIVATQMLQSMINEPVPTRAEVSDVANAIIDGSDAVMLSGETAVGRYPVEAVKMMRRVAQQTNEYLKEIDSNSELLIKYKGSMNRKAAMARGVHQMARDIRAKYIVLWTHSGGSSVFLSQQRLQVPLIAFGENISRLRQLSLLYGVTPVYMKQPESGSSFIREIDCMMLEQGWAKQGDAVIIVASDPITKKGLTNRVVLHYIGESVE